MAATSQLSRNRIARHLDMPLPTGATARADLLSDAVCASVVALQRLLTHPDPEVVLKAAEMILDLEKTRLRHGRPVSGTTPVAQATVEPVAEPDETDDQRFERYVQFIRQQVQGETGVEMPREEAERLVRETMADARREVDVRGSPLIGRNPSRP